MGELEKDALCGLSSLERSVRGRGPVEEVGRVGKVEAEDVTAEREVRREAAETGY